MQSAEKEGDSLTFYWVHVIMYELEKEKLPILKGELLT
jgi:hypothetical protein